MYLDYDGILCDFNRGAALLHERDPNVEPKTWSYYESEWGMDANHFFKKMTADFWRDLPIFPYAKDLYKYLKGIIESAGAKLKVLTAPVETRYFSCVEGKMKHFSRHFGDPRLEMIVHCDKSSFYKPKAMLIDDSPANLKSWSGEKFEWPRTYNSAGRPANQDDINRLLLRVSQWL